MAVTLNSLHFKLLMEANWSFGHHFCLNIQLMDLVDDHLQKGFSSATVGIMAKL